MTRGVRDHLRDRVDAVFEDLGEQSVKNISRPLRVFRVKFDPEGEPVLDIVPPVADRSEMMSSVENSFSQHNSDNDETLVEVAFWEAVRESDDPAEYTLYLDRFPEGQFTELARARLESGVAIHHDPAVEVAYWETVRESGKEEMIEAYLTKFPQGQFNALADLILAGLRERSAE